MILYRTRCDRYQAIIDCQELDGAETLLLAALNSHLIDAKPVCWPSQTTLAKCTKMSDRNVRRVIKRLCVKGFVIIRGKSSDGTDQLEINWLKLPFSKGKGRAKIRGQILWLQLALRLPQAIEQQRIAWRVLA